MDAREIQARAKRRYAALARHREDPRYRRVLGRLVAADLLTSNEEVEPHRSPIDVQDVLWVGKIEPRVLELLPALIVKRPALFQSLEGLPNDLASAVAALRRNRSPEPFRGIDGDALKRWVPLLGHRNKLPSQLRSFRLKADDVELLERLSAQRGISQTAVVRQALRSLAIEHGVRAKDA
jgi:hypothetical protein